MSIPYSIRDVFIIGTSLINGEIQELNLTLFSKAVRVTE
jgi:hypothetical protein